MAYEYAHAARINDEGFVDKVLVIPYLDDNDVKITEYLNSLGAPGNWLDCSYIGARRGMYPGVGFRYDADLDEFVPPPKPEIVE